jgi:hypothetical protein
MMEMDEMELSQWNVKKENLFEERRSRDEFIFF